MCVTCGCGAVHDDHGNDANITIEDFGAAGAAVGIPIETVFANVAAAMPGMAAPQPDDDDDVDDDDSEDIVLKALALAESPQRFVLGVAYPADKLDGHGEFMTRKELELTAWDYARNHRRVGFFHANGTEGHADVVESYVYRGPDWATADIDGGEQVIKAGDWVLGAILDEPGFALVTSRKADGWSVDGVAKKRRARAPKGD